MFEDLVKRLRTIRPEDYDNPMDFAFGVQQAMCESADAIEKLSKKVEEWQEEACKWNNEYYNLLDNTPDWIPMTERPPEEELAFYQCYTDAGMVVQCLWTNNRTGLGPLGEWGWRFTDVPPRQKVTHWMLLPEPPKEK